MIAVLVVTLLLALSLFGGSGVINNIDVDALAGSSTPISDLIESVVTEPGDASPDVLA